MCGIVGFSGLKSAEPFLHQALAKLEYRGYDSYGYLVYNQDQWFAHREVGKSIKDHVPNLWLGTIGIGHTRWATHGAPSLLNTHPILCGQRLQVEERFYKHLTDHLNNLRKLYEPGPRIIVGEPTVAIVHNGIVDNFDELKQTLKQYYKFSTETDTEAIGHYIDFLFRYHTKSNVPEKIAETIRPVFDNIKGNFAIIVMSTHFPDHLVAMSRGMPLLFTSFGHVASDINAFSGFATKACRLKDNDILVASKGSGILFPWRDIEPDLEDVPTASESDLNQFTHYMHKEIHQQARLNTIPTHIEIDKPEKVYIFGCGSSWHAGLVAKYYFENLANIPTEVEYASEAQYRNLSYIQPKNTLFIGLTQSGETKDTLQVMRGLIANKRNVLAIHNSPGSTAIKLATHQIDIKAGPEIGVAATKTFWQQLKALLAQANYFGEKKDLTYTWNALESSQMIFGAEEEIKSLAKDIYKYKNILYLGRGAVYPIALEGALKMKEVAYVHAEAMPAAELKHGPLALIDKETLCIFLCNTQESIGSESVRHNMSEVKSRGGLILSISDSIAWGWAQANTDYSFKMPRTTWFTQPFLFNIPLQLLAYYVALERGLNVDRPRNLAKSVTV